jgi:sterol desaturase/sphingolipid hydroxylase (fatty acid hydroxylase superfamily)
MSPRLTLDALNLLYFSTRLTALFLLWTLAEYFLHRFMHINHSLNIFFHIHRHHHNIPIEKLTAKTNRWPKFSYFFFWFDNLYETIEIVFGETIPALIIYYFDPECGIYILIFHYVYELLATDSLLEHNPEIKEKSVIKYFAVGQFHLEHHRRANKNFGFTITLWDHLFGTYKYYDEKKIETK